MRTILEFFFQIVCYYIGRVVVPILSLGRIQCDRLATDTPRQKLRWGGLFHRQAERVYLTAEATSGVGLLIVVLVVAATFLIYS